jgi:hypothetical protein
MEKLHDVPPRIEARQACTASIVSQKRNLLKETKRKKEEEGPFSP